MRKGVHLYIGSHMGTHLWTKEVDQIKDQNRCPDQKWTHDPGYNYEAMTTRVHTCGDDKTTLQHLLLSSIWMDQHQHAEEDDPN